MHGRLSHVAFGILDVFSHSLAFFCAGSFQRHSNTDRSWSPSPRAHCPPDKKVKYTSNCSSVTGSRRCLTQPRKFQKRHHLWRVLKDSKKRPVGWKCIQGVGPQYARTRRWETGCSICREQSMSVGQVEGEMWGPALRRLCPRWLQVKTSVFKKSPEDQLWEFRLISQFVKLEY